MERIRIEYDKSWKEVVTQLFRPFVGFFLANLHEQIDWEVTPEFLEKELHNAKNIKKSKRIVDKLVKVQLKNGEEQWIFVHIEFQTDGDKIIGLRMYEYYQLIRERYGKEVVALVIYTGSSVPKLPNIYHQTFFGTSITYQFNSYAVVEQTEKVLLDDPNPFALVILANLYLLQTKHNDEKRYELKTKLYELIKNRHFSIDDFTKLLIFVSELVKLPPLLEQKFEKEVIYSSNKKDIGMYKNLNSTSKALINVIAEQVFGESIEDSRARADEAKAEVAEVKAKIAEVKVEVAEVKAEIAEVKVEIAEVTEAKAEAELKLKQSDEQISKSIVLFYTRFDMSIDEIGEQLKLSTTVVKEILMQNNVLK